MTEGELYRKIHLADGETKRWGEGYRTFKAQDTIEQVLDEAKKDVLGLWEKHPRYLAMRQKKGDYTNIRCFYRARDDWLFELLKKLEKWFGSSEEPVEVER